MDKAELYSKINMADVPFYLYDTKTIESKIALVKSLLPDFNLIYSVKANPHSLIISHMAEKRVGFDVASSNEVLLAIENGGTSENIYYSAPGKTDADLSSTLECCNVIVDSLNELKRVDTIALICNSVLTVGVRLNVGNQRMEESRHEVMGGKPSKFGIELAELLMIKPKIYPNIRIVGLHIYFGSQILDSTLISNNFHIIADTAISLNKLFALEYVNFGGGFGIPYEKTDSPLDLADVASALQNDSSFKELKSLNIRLNLELGRFLVGESGFFVTRVLDVKISFGKKYIIVDGGMNAFYRPIMTNDFHNIIQFENHDDSSEIVTIVGKLCTPIDTYYTDIKLPAFSIGDIIAFRNAGAYGYSMSLLDFISYNKPKEIIV